MPKIISKFERKNNGARSILKEEGPDLVSTVAMISGYKREEVELIPEMMEAREAELAINMKPLSFMIFIGNKNGQTGDHTAKSVMSSILANCPKLAKVPFSLWICEMRHNGYIEHNPA